MKARTILVAAFPGTLTMRLYWPKAEVMEGKWTAQQLKRAE
jgi:hypothetical protein